MIKFFVPGCPKPGGSKRSFKHPHTGKIITIDANPNVKHWRNDVKDFAMKAYQGNLLDEALRLDIIFIMPRPKNHYRNNGDLKPNAPHYHTNRPDRTKLLRSIEDSLTGIIWRDDALIATGTIEKIYGDKPGAIIEITTCLRTGDRKLYWKLGAGKAEVSNPDAKITITHGQAITERPDKKNGSL